MNKTQYLTISILATALSGSAQIETPFYGVNGTYVDLKKQLIKKDSTGILFYAVKDKSRIVFFPYNLRIYKVFDKNHKLLAEGDLGGKRFFTDYVLHHGKWTEYFNNGRVKAIGNYHEDKPVGSWQFYFINGQLKKKLSYFIHKDSTFYKDSIYFTCLSDQYVEYYDNGQPKVKGYYKIKLDTVDSELHFWEGDKEKIEKECECCSLQATSRKSGTWIYYKRNGEVEKKEEYEK